MVSPKRVFLCVFLCVCVCAAGGGLLGPFVGACPSAFVENVHVRPQTCASICVCVCVRERDVWKLCI